MDTRSDDMTSVRIVGSDNDLVLVQWADGDNLLHRSWVSRDSLRQVRDNQAEVRNPSAGIPYGVEVWRLIKLKASPKDFDRELKNRGIWTLADLRTRPNEVLGALITAYGVDLGALYQALRQYEADLAQTEA